MKKNARVVLLLVVIVLAAGVSVMYVVRNEPWLSADSAFQKGAENAKKQKYKTAFHYMEIAAQKAPDSSKYTWAATQMAIAANNANKAYYYAQKTWKNGRKERDILFYLIRFSFFQDKKQKLDYALSRVNEMGANTDKDDLRVDILMLFGEFDKARQLCERNYDKSPVPYTAVKLARLYVQSGNDSLAMSFLQSCRQRLALNDEGYGVLAQLYAKKGNLEEAELCYREGAENNRSSEQLQYDHAAFLMNSGKYDQAAVMADSLIEKYPENKNFETIRIGAFINKGDNAGALRECDKSTVPFGLIAPLRVKALVNLNRFAEAEAVYDSAIAHNNDLRIRLEFGNFLLYKTKNYKKARTIFQSVNSARPDEPVANIGLATLDIYSHDPAAAKKHIAAVLSSEKKMPYPYLLLARINLIENDPKSAIDNCDKVLAHLPGLGDAAYIKAQAYYTMGQYDKTDQIMTTLINRAGIDKKKAAFYTKAIIPIKIKEKKYDEAIALINNMGHGADSIAMNRMLLEVYAISNNPVKAEQVLSSLEGNIDKSSYSYYQSWLAELEGDTAKAAAFLESDLSTKSFFMRWASLRIKMGKVDNVMEKLNRDSMNVADWVKIAAIADKRKYYEFSSECYKNALMHETENAALLNNYAWASMQTSSFNHDEVLKAVKKAYNLMPDNIDVLQTYSEALNKCDKSKECINLLKDKLKQTRQNANILYQLGIAYEKTGDIRGATSSFQLMLQLPDSVIVWPEGISRSGLQGHVGELKKITPHID
jgi:predicted Zn-dependent protease